MHSVLGQKIIDKIRLKKELKLIWFYNCYKKYKSLDSKKRFSINKIDFHPCLDDNTSTTGIDTQYEYHQAWAARCLAKTAPKKHIDISSRITFNVVSSAFIPIEFYDYRPAEIYNLSDFKCGKADLTNLFFEDNSIESLSCMHTVEHIGLGRYGDEIDTEGDLKAINELKRVLKKGGNIFFVVPVGKPKIQFNSQRIYSYEMILEYFKGFELVEYALIPDNAKDVGILYNATKEMTDKNDNACGCFWFRK